MRILVTGASGLIGKNLIRQSLIEGHEIRALVRNPRAFKMLPENQVFKWSHDSGLNADVFDGVDAVVHLAGENIADRRWTAERKRLLVQSRVRGTREIVSALRRLPDNRRPRVLISGSAIGFYGYQRDGWLDETASPGDDFLAKLCVEWEKEAREAETLGVRVVLARTGIVLSKEGGALSKMPPVRISNGQNWMSWIHVQDVVRALLFVLKDGSLKGPINLVAPHPVRNGDFIREMAKVLRVPSLGFVPGFFLNIALGELSNALLSSLQVRPSALLDGGFSFDYPDLASALRREIAGHHVLDRVFVKDQFLPLAPEKIFDFFSRAENLEILTPPWLKFRIISKSTPEIQKGTLIDYRLRIHGAPVRWRTKIAEWKPNEFFIDDQLKGPYSKWHHLHRFDAVPGGCLIRDEVTYRVPGSILGSVLLSGWISKDVNQIFSYRQERIQELLPRSDGEGRERS